ncbi:Carboxypeptidase [Mycena indigotica]|uniref:Carboxypeptidase n=1 Tax=Mycena indigotica TaxID=2126181 RepID=A0A8H6S3Z1_9AGAR|nr:Carboxypeptidase [Mycena indigotica]KAF7292745.1 Carboxypeptidase [Mycena indigotica]
MPIRRRTRLATALLAGVLGVLLALLVPRPGRVGPPPRPAPDAGVGTEAKRVERREIVTARARIAVHDLCEAGVREYAGYVDVARDRHLFFRYFESRTDPARDPLVLWLQGGPGDSGAVGALLESGPCRVAANGSAARNPHSWTRRANVIYLDQPVGVGFSFSSSPAPHSAVDTNAAAAADVHAFLRLFLAHFPALAGRALHVVGESYGGIYAPHVAALIWAANQTPGATPIALASVVLANGITDPAVQIPSIAEYVCGPAAAHGVLDAAECRTLRRAAPACAALIRVCNLLPTEATCGYAARWCRARLFAPCMKPDRNWYDLRQRCDAAGAAIARPEWCYARTAGVARYMAAPATAAALGVAPARAAAFRAFNMDINAGWNARGEGVRDAARLLGPLVDGGVRLLVYAGNQDMMANYVGNERWVGALRSKHRAAFAATAPGRAWVPRGAAEAAGRVRSAGPVAFVEVYDAGHMVAHDRPAAALDLFERWVAGEPLDA